jgi:DNA-binding CsgD family transcriptional regulator
LDPGLLESLHDLADREQRAPEAVARDLIASGLAQRQTSDKYLACWGQLSPREQQVAALACLNYTNRQIAAQLVISPETVKTHMRNLLRKFDLRSKVQLRRALTDWDFSAWV